MKTMLYYTIQRPAKTIKARLPGLFRSVAQIFTGCQWSPVILWACCALIRPVLGACGHFPACVPGRRLLWPVFAPVCLLGASDPGTGSGFGVFSVQDRGGGPLRCRCPCVQDVSAPVPPCVRPVSGLFPVWHRLRKQKITVAAPLRPSFRP